jgi:hypothetical protein
MFKVLFNMWCKNSSDKRAKYYLQLQKEREVREEREKQELERQRKEEDQLIAQETKKRDKIRQANLEVSTMPKKTKKNICRL